MEGHDIQRTMSRSPASCQEIENRKQLALGQFLCCSRDFSKVQNQEKVYDHPISQDIFWWSLVSFCARLSWAVPMSFRSQFWRYFYLIRRDRVIRSKVFSSWLVLWMYNSLHLTGFPSSRRRLSICRRFSPHQSDRHHIFVCGPSSQDPALHSKQHPAEVETHEASCFARNPAESTREFELNVVGQPRPRWGRESSPELARIERNLARSPDLTDSAGLKQNRM
jgi:hypothetical protein